MELTPAECHTITRMVSGAVLPIQPNFEISKRAFSGLSMGAVGMPLVMAPSTVPSRAAVL